MSLVTPDLMNKIVPEDPNQKRFWVFVTNNRMNDIYTEFGTITKNDEGNYLLVDKGFHKSDVDLKKYFNNIVFFGFTTSSQELENSNDIVVNKFGLISTILGKRRDYYNIVVEDHETNKEFILDITQCMNVSLTEYYLDKKGHLDIDLTGGSSRQMTLDGYSIGYKGILKYDEKELEFSVRAEVPNTEKRVVPEFSVMITPKCTFKGQIRILSTLFYELQDHISVGTVEVPKNATYRAIFNYKRPLNEQEFEDYKKIICK